MSSCLSVGPMLHIYTLTHDVDLACLLIAYPEIQGEKQTADIDLGVQHAAVSAFSDPSTYTKNTEISKIARQNAMVRTALLISWYVWM